MSKSDDIDISAEDVGVHSWRQLIPPTRWAREVHDTSIEFFEVRIRVMDSEEHLRAAVRREGDRDKPRKKRIAKLNNRMQEVEKNADGI